MDFVTLNEKNGKTYGDRNLWASGAGPYFDLHLTLLHSIVES